ncbi:hypothetical protein GIB67_023131 [Kingdonia uniflora]|uniref:Uncharacterized protein n=1 Tax=Kingdonia uniflora TaxID=39325 RepID=A0A7J7M5M7_9MAGN|nr:hypothetical protein GIB67_023131 [Kingdonia uniflora]
MGSLTTSSSSFPTLDFRFRSNPKRKPQIRALERKNTGLLLSSLYRGGRSESWGRVNRFTCFSSSNGGNEGDEETEEKKNSDEKKATMTTPASISSRLQMISPELEYNNLQVETLKLMELLGPEKVDPSDVKLIKENLFGYSTFWLIKEEPFGDFGEGTLFIGNLRGKREDVFAKLQRQLVEITGDKYNLFMVEEPDSEEPDPRGGPRVSFGLMRKEVSEPGQTTLWQYVIAILLFVLTIGSSVELGIASQINRLPPEVVKYFTDPNATDPPDMQLLLPFVDSALPLAYGVLGVQLFHRLNVEAEI